MVKPFLGAERPITIFLGVLKRPPHAADVDMSGVPSQRPHGRLEGQLGSTGRQRQAIHAVTYSCFGVAGRLVARWPLSGPNIEDMFPSMVYLYWDSCPLI